MVACADRPSPAQLSMCLAYGKDNKKRLTKSSPEG
jgi:hypothetical protein